MSKEKYEKYIAEYIDSHYSELIHTIRKTNTYYNVADVISELYIFLIDNQKKIENLKEIKGKDRPLDRFCSDWIYKSLRLYTANNGLSNFQSKFNNKTNELFLNQEDNSTDDSQEEEYSFVIKHKLHQFNDVAEYEDEIEDKWLTQNLTKDKILKIKILEHVLMFDLTEHEKRIYQLYIQEQRTINQMKELIPRISRNSFELMIQELKRKITEKVKERYEKEKLNEC